MVLIFACNVQEKTYQLNRADDIKGYRYNPEDTMDDVAKDTAELQNPVKLYDDAPQEVYDNLPSRQFQLATQQLYTTISESLDWI